MNYKKKILLIISGLLTFYSCYKDPYDLQETIVYGTVSDATTGEKIEGAKVLIANVAELDSSYTDKNGHYEFRYDVKTKSLHHHKEVKVEHALYDTIRKPIVNGAINHINFKLQP